MADPSSKNPQPPADVAGFLHREASGDNPLLPEPDRGKDDRMESMQRSLAERIAAVEEERRRSADETSHALETQRKGVALQMRRQRLLLFLTLALMILLTLAVVGYVQLRLQGAQTQISDRLAQLSQEIAAFEPAPAAGVTRGSGADGLGRREAEEVARLSARTTELDAQVESIRERLARLLVEMAELKTNLESPLSTPLPEPQPMDTAPTSAGAAKAGMPNKSLPSESLPSESVPSESVADRRSIDELVAALRPSDAEGKDPGLEPKVSSPAVAPPDEAVERTEDQPRTPAADQQRTEPAASHEAVGPEREAVRPEGEAVGAEFETAEGSSTIKVGARPVALQLIGFRNPELLDAFIARNPLPAEVYTRQETFRGRPWFVLIHSIHPGRQAARAASDALPGALASLDVWIRELPGGSELEVIKTSGEAP